ncbi:MAG: hypothetical protein QM598_05895 [Protaetiibacter sp.]
MKQPTDVHWTVEATAKTRMDELADRAGVSQAVFFERMVASIELNESGLPTWWVPEPRPEELPIEEL